MGETLNPEVSVLRLPRANGFRRNPESSGWVDFYTVHHPSMFSDEEYTKVYQVSGADLPRISHLKVGLKPTDWNYKFDVQSAIAARDLHSIPVRVVTNANYHGAEMTTLGEALKDIPEQVTIYRSYYRDHRHDYGDAEITYYKVSAKHFFLLVDLMDPDELDWDRVAEMPNLHWIPVTQIISDHYGESKETFTLGELLREFT